MRGVRLEVLRKYMDASDKTRIQYASKFAGSSNYWKNSIGMNKASSTMTCWAPKPKSRKSMPPLPKENPNTRVW